LHVVVDKLRRSQAPGGDRLARPPSADHAALLPKFIWAKDADTIITKAAPPKNRNTHHVRDTPIAKR
jgi:hypothetical protein